jgi:hypothetical protein
MAFPTTPTNGQIATVNGITFSYDSATNSWTRVSSALTNIANIVITSNANVGNLNAINNVTGSTGNFSGNVFATGIVGTTYYGQVNLGTTSVNLNRASASQTLTGIGIDGTAATATAAVNSQLTANTSAGVAYIAFARQTAGNVPLNATTSLTFNPSTGNLTTYGMFTSTGVYWAGNGAAYSSGGGISYTASNTAPSSPTIGSVWYDTATDIIFQYINDGTNSIWVDTGSVSSNVANVIVANTVTANTLTTTRSLSVNSDNQTIAIANGGTNGVGNIGSSAVTFNTIFAKATSAQYADLAENYLADAIYSAGTVVVFGGSKEITISTVEHDFRVAGVVSTNPAYIMNSTIDGVPVALTGKVPCWVLGPVNKGDILVTSKISGAAEKLNMQKYIPGCVMGKSLEEIDSNELKLIEVVVGRF